MVTLLAKNYNVVAYHNFSHAFYFTMVKLFLFSSLTNVLHNNFHLSIFVTIRSTSIFWWLDSAMISITVKIDFIQMGLRTPFKSKRDPNLPNKSKINLFFRICIYDTYGRFCKKIRI